MTNSDNAEDRASNIKKAAKALNEALATAAEEGLITQLEVGTTKSSAGEHPTVAVKVGRVDWL